MSDLISRADAIKAIRKCKFESVMPSDWYIGMECAQDIVKDVPSAEAVQGEWIDRSNGGRIKYPWWESCECNQCGEYGSGAYNYCPNCGARMKGGAE